MLATELPRFGRQVLWPLGELGQHTQEQCWSSTRAPKHQHRSTWRAAPPSFLSLVFHHHQSYSPLPFSSSHTQPTTLSSPFVCCPAYHLSNPQITTVSAIPARLQYLHVPFPIKAKRPDHHHPFPTLSPFVPSLTSLWTSSSSPGS